jgi:voltage-gated potassium channel
VMSRGHIDNPLLRFRLAAVLLLIVISIGVAGYMIIEGWDLLDAFFMTIITISTVGYSEIHPLSVAGRLFTSGLIVVGVGTMLFGFGVFAETLADNSFGVFGRQRQMEARLNALRDHFIICGYGRIGAQVVIEFEAQHVPYVIIERNEEPLGRVQKDRRLHVEGDAASEELLKQAGIERAKGLVCAVDSDERAVYIVLAARALNPKLYVIARAGYPESIRRLELAGADRVISPYRMAGHLMAELAVRPAVVDVLDTLHHGESDVGLQEVLVGPRTGAVGKTIAEAGLLDAARARLLAVRRRDGSLHVNPTGDLRLEEGDLLIALGTEPQLLATAAALN